jgi:hypothetical protein
MNLYTRKPKEKTKVLKALHNYRTKLEKRATDNRIKHGHYGITVADLRNIYQDEVRKIL